MNDIKTKLMQIAKSSEFVGTILAIVVFAGVALAYFYPDAFEGNVLRQHDVLQGVAVGQEVKAYQEATGETSRWTNSLFSGMPTFQISPSYKSSALISWIGKVYGLGLPSPANLVFIMMLGFFILLKSVRTRWYLAILGALAWGFSTYFFIIIGAGHIWKYITLAYVPPTLAGIIWAYRGKYLTGGVVAALFATLQIASNHIQMSYYFMFLIAGIVIAYLVKAVKEKTIPAWCKSTAVLACAAVLAVLANSPNLYNTYKYSKETMRGGHSELSSANVGNTTAGGLNKDYITQWSYGGDELLTLLVPNAKGGANIKPEKGENLPLLLADTDEAQKMLNNGKLDQQTFGTLRSFYQYFGDQPMTNGPVYVGAFIFALFIFGCIVVKGPLKWAVLIVTIITVMLSLGHNMMWFSDLFIDYFPMYNKFRTVSSILVVAELTMPLLAVMGLQKLLDADNGEKTSYVKPLLISFGVSALLCLILWMMPSMLIGNGFPKDEYAQYASQGLVAQYPAIFSAIASVRHAMVSSDALRSLLVLIFAFAAVMAYVKGKMSAKLTCAALVCVLIADLYTVNKRYLNSDSFTASVPVSAQQFTPRSVDTEILKDTTMNYRVLDLSKFADAMPSYYHKTIGGYHAAKLSRYQDIIDRHIAGEKGITEQVINMLNAKYIIYDDNNVAENPDAMGNAWFVDELKFVDTPDAEINALYNIDVHAQAVADRKFSAALRNNIPAKADGDTIYETSYAPNRLTYHCNRASDGVAVFSEVYFPWGWTATVDGNKAEIARVNYILRAINVPAGSHTVEFEFNPKSVSVTETLAYVAMAIIYIGILVLIIAALRGKHES